MKLNILNLKSFLDVKKSENKNAYFVLVDLKELVVFLLIEFDL